MKLISIFLVMFVANTIAFAEAQTTIDWTLNKDYSTYSTQSFKPGGTLLFNYATPTHDMVVVNKSDYDNCATGNALQTFTSGKTTITLEKGAMYFICGKPGHCQAGMKLQVNVADDDSSTTPTTPATPATPGSNPPSPSKDTSDVARISSGVVIVGALVLGALFA